MTTTTTTKKNPENIMNVPSAKNSFPFPIRRTNVKHNRVAGTRNCVNNRNNTFKITIIDSHPKA